jgi:hypothetical protein
MKTKNLRPILAVVVNFQVEVELMVDLLRVQLKFHKQ